MNSTLILFLNMLKSDIKNYVYEKKSSNSSGNLLTGQTITKSELENLTSMKLMKPEEKEVVYSIMSSMIQTDAGIENNKRLLKNIPGIAPNMYDTDEVQAEFKDAA